VIIRYKEIYNYEGHKLKRRNLFFYNPRWEIEIIGYAMIFILVRKL